MVVHHGGDVGTTAASLKPDKIDFPPCDNYGFMVKMVSASSADKGAFLSARSKARPTDPEKLSDIHEKTIKSYTDMRTAYCNTGMQSEQMSHAEACDDEALTKAYNELIRPTSESESQPMGLDKRAYHALTLQRHAEKNKRSPVVQKVRLKKQLNE